MWQSILLGKLSVSTIASLVIGCFCVSRPWYREGMSFNESSSWIGIGVFFLVLALAQVVMVYFMFRKKKFE
jgi:hypothetical protein